MQNKSLAPSAWRRLLARHADLPDHTRRQLELGRTAFTAGGIRFTLAGSFAERNAGAVAAPKPTGAKRKPKVAATTRGTKPVVAAKPTSASARLAAIAGGAGRPTSRAVTTPNESASAKVARLASEAADRAVRDDTDTPTLPPAA